LSGGGGKAGKDFPGAGAVGCFITAGYFSGNDRRPQLPFGKVVGGIHLGVIQKGEEMVFLFFHSVANFLFDIRGPWLGQ
jgi:hypothetical protein